MSRNNLNKNFLSAANFKFRAVDNFKYLGVNINNKHNMHKEVNERVMSKNLCFYTIMKLLKGCQHAYF